MFISNPNFGQSLKIIQIIIVRVSVVLIIENYSPAFGSVYLARLKNGATVAAKKQTSRFSPDVYEMRVLEIIGGGSEHVIGYFGCSSSYLLLEYCPNGNLWQRIEAYGSTLMPLDEVLSFSHQLLHGLNWLHSKGIFHGDIKPLNIVLDAQRKLKLTDFGSVTLQGNRWSGKGTDDYLPPEALQPYGHHPAPVDLWSSGVVIFNMMYGRNPYSNFDPDKCAFMNALVSRNYGRLWRLCDKVRTVSADFKLMMESLLEPEPSRRATIEQLRRNSWFSQKCRSCPWCLSTPVAGSSPSVSTECAVEMNDLGNRCASSTNFCASSLVDEAQAEAQAGSSRFLSSYVTFVDPASASLSSSCRA